jgi:hypothetical protein
MCKMNYIHCIFTSPIQVRNIKKRGIIHSWSKCNLLWTRVFVYSFVFTSPIKVRTIKRSEIIHSWSNLICCEHTCLFIVLFVIFTSIWVFNLSNLLSLIIMRWRCFPPTTHYYIIQTSKDHKQNYKQTRVFTTY